MVSNVTILAVDDVAENLVLLKVMLSGTYKFCIAKSVKGALEVLKNTKVDLVLLDIEMPEEDGFDFIKKMRDNYAYKDIPVIFVTGNAQIETVKKAMDAGAKGYLVKPIQKEALLKKVSDSLPKNQAFLNSLETMKHTCITGNVNQANEALINLQENFIHLERSTSAGIRFDEIVNLIRILDYDGAVKKIEEMQKLLKARSR